MFSVRRDPSACLSCLLFRSQLSTCQTPKEGNANLIPISSIVTPNSVVSLCSRNMDRAILRASDQEITLVLLSSVYKDRVTAHVTLVLL